MPFARVRCRPVSECRKVLERVPTKKKKKIEKPLRLPVQVRRQTRPEHRLLVVRLRKSGLTYKRISQLTSLPLYTCYHIYYNFMKRKTVVPRKTTGRPALSLPPDVEEYLMNNLEEDRFLSLQDRVKIIKRKFDFPMYPQRLMHFYRRNNIKYQMCKTVPKAALLSKDART